MFFSAGCRQNNKIIPQAQKGIIDLSSWDFDNDGLAELNGQWEFYWNKILTPGEFQTSDNSRLHYFELPSQWNGIKNTELKNLPPLGKATYRLIVKLPKNNSRRVRTLCLKFQDIHSSYKVWLNGRLYLEKGTFSEVPEKCIPASGREAVSFEDSSASLEIVINAVNFFDTNEAGIDEKILLGTEQGVILESQLKNFFYLVSFGILLIMGLYHFLLFIIRRKEREYLYFSVICLLLAVQTICEGDKYVFYILPGLSVSFYLKAWLASISVVAVLLRFFRIIFPDELNKTAVNFFTAAFIFEVLFLFIFPIEYFMPFIYPTFYFSIIVVGYLFYGLFLALLRKRKHSVLVFAGMLLPLLAGINDLLYGLAIIYTGYFGSVGFILLIFSQSYFLSLRYNESYMEVESLSKELEAANRSLDSKVEERTLELKAVNAELSKTIAIKNKFFSIIAHEMKNLFQSMFGYSDLIIMKSEKDEQQEINEGALVIKDTTTKAYNLMENLLEWSLSETGNIRLKKELLNLKSVVNENVELMDAYGRAKHVCLSARVDESLQISADKRMLNTVLRNLISNAIKYSFSDSTVTVRAEKQDTNIIIFVSDEGMGIESEKLDKIFMSETVQSTPGTNKEKGTGLGLLLVKEFVQKHNGTISASSEIGKGTTFEITLPVS
ncbi:MAG TPA: sensor histidine kinase [Ignavibacteriales bacterium]|nr:sensor histidine kinase [Ignavibacteriales bacterium]